MARPVRRWLPPPAGLPRAFLRAGAAGLTLSALVIGCAEPGGDGDREEPGGADEVTRDRTGEDRTSLSYRLHVPGTAGPSPPLLVALHGCTQDAEDFAAGTRLDARAGQRGYLVLYPEQRADAHPQRCWRWFERAHQRRGRGEPGSLMELVEEIVREHDVDRDRVHLAGLSAGAGMAVVLAALHPRSFAGVAVHSGVPYAAVSSEERAPELLAGRGPPAGELARRLREVVPDGARLPPLLAIHGAADSLVSPENTRRLVAAWLSSEDPPAEVDHPDVRSRGTGGEAGYAWERRRWDASDRPPVEAWRVERLGHAWSGGSPEGSWTDPAGPDATRIVLDFLEEAAGVR